MKLRAWRTSKGLKLAELAERIETDVAALSRYERDERIPNQDKMRKIAEVTGGAVTANDFYGIDVSTAENPPKEAAPDQGETGPDRAPAAKVA